MNKASLLTMTDGPLTGLLRSKSVLVVYSLAAGIIGTGLMAAFGMILLSPAGVSVLLPWIVGFNAAMTGFMIVDKSANRLPRNRLAAAGCGAVLAIAAGVLIDRLAVYQLGTPIVRGTDVALFVPVATVLAVLGAVLAAKARQLRADR